MSMERFEEWIRRQIDSRYRNRVAFAQAAFISPGTANRLCLSPKGVNAGSVALAAVALGYLPDDVVKLWEGKAVSPRPLTASQDSPLHEQVAAVMESPSPARDEVLRVVFAALARMASSGGPSGAQIVRETPPTRQPEPRPQPQQTRRGR